MLLFIQRYYAVPAAACLFLGGSAAAQNITENFTAYPPKTLILETDISKSAADHSALLFPSSLTYSLSKKCQVQFTTDNAAAAGPFHLSLKPLLIPGAGGGLAVRTGIDYDEGRPLGATVEAIQSRDLTPRLHLDSNIAVSVSPDAKPQYRLSLAPSYALSPAWQAVGDIALFPGGRPPFEVYAGFVYMYRPGHYTSMGLMYQPSRDASGCTILFSHIFNFPL